MIPETHCWICKFPNYLIKKTIFLSTPQLVKFYENNNLGLCSLQTFSKKLYLTRDSFFFVTPCTYIMLKFKLTKVASINPLLLSTSTGSGTDLRYLILLIKTVSYSLIFYIFYNVIFKQCVKKLFYVESSIRRCFAR